MTLFNKNIFHIKFNLIFLLFVTKCESSLKLVFSDEFNENTSIDPNKWEVAHELANCDGM